MMKIKNIVLACNAGMSTSMLVEKMKLSASQKDYDVEIYAISQNEIEQELSINANKIGVVLLGPQVKYMLPVVKDICTPHSIKVDAIDMLDYGMMNGDKVFSLALEMLK